MIPARCGQSDLVFGVELEVEVDSVLDELDLVVSADDEVDEVVDDDLDVSESVDEPDVDVELDDPPRLSVL